MRKHSFSVPTATAPAPIELREAKVFKINASRYNLCPEANEKVYEYLNQVHQAALDRLISNPVKPGSYHEVLGKAWTELADVGSAVRKKDIHKAKFELFDCVVTLFLLGSLSDHLIKID